VVLAVVLATNCHRAGVACAGGRARERPNLLEASITALRKVSFGENEELIERLIRLVVACWGPTSRQGHSPIDRRGNSHDGTPAPGSVTSRTDSEDPWTLVCRVHWLLALRYKRMCPVFVFVRLEILGLGQISEPAPTCSADERWASYHDCADEPDEEDPNIENMLR
jgi:hypothetical protein